MGGAVFAVALGGIVLVGWAFDITALTQLSPTFASMKVNTAVCFVLLGASLWRQRDREDLLGRGLACVVIAISGLTLVEIAANRSLGIDELVVRDAIGHGQMSVAAAISMLLLGGGLALLDRRIGNVRIAQATALPVAGLALLVILPYAYGAR